MSNRTTLAQLAKLKVADASMLPVDQLAALLEDVADLKETLKGHEARLFGALDLKYSGRAAVLRKQEGKDSGTVTVLDGDYQVKADLPKTVEWDNDGLEAAGQKLADMGEPVTDYIKIKRTIAEAAYQGWPASLKAMVSEHRTVKAGKPTYKIVLKAA